MNTLREALQDYLAMRRALGFKLHDAGVGLQDFVSFLERKRLPISPLAWHWSGLRDLPLFNQRTGLSG